MLTFLDVPYVDSTADGLSFALGLDPLPALDTLVISDIASPGTQLELRLLGASHQATLRTSRGTCSEVVACLPTEEPELPAAVDTHVAGSAYRFRAQVRRLESEEFGREVTALTDRLAMHPRALVGIFPGAPHAVTALLAEPIKGGIQWRTWHAYPQTGELAITRTTVEVV